MSQHEVYQLLKNNKGKKYNVKEIANELGITSMSSLTTNCAKMRRANDIACEIRKSKEGRRMFYYYYPKTNVKIDNSKYFY